MKRFRPVVSIAILSALTLAAAPLRAQSASQVVVFEVRAVNELGVTGSPNLTIDAAKSGEGELSVQSTGNTWSVTTNQARAKVTAALDESMPDGVTLSAQLAAPVGAASAGMKHLSTTPVDMVTSINRLNQGGLPLVYELSANAMLAKNTKGTRAVTYTITGGA
ncbi:MAG: hypothetical protein ACHQWU_11035 [Gemmatimonadales bacterium]